MLLSDFARSIEIISVLDINRKKDNGYTNGRDFHAISFRVKGGAVFNRNGENIFATNGSLCFVPEGASYEIKTEDERLYVVHFKTAYPEKINTILTYTPKSPIFYENLFKKIYSLWAEKQPGYYFAVSSLFYTFFESIEKELLQQNTKNSSDNMSKVIKYIHSNFSDSSLSVSTLAEIFGTSETYFRKMFKKAYEVTPLKYINNLRAQYAIELLASGYYLVNQAAEKSGFSDPKYFYHIIKNKTGHSPSEIIPLNNKKAPAYKK